MSLPNEYYVLRGVIAEMPQPDQDIICGYVKQFEDLVTRGGDHALVALSLVGAKHVRGQQ